jgi:ABC-type dipeptide/oligopeptide/nickel transport system permease subunit
MSATEVAVLSPRARMRRRMRRRLLRRPLAVAGLVIALAFVLIAIFAPVLAPYDPGASDFTAALQGPSAKHLLGTDELGRDILSRLIWSARVSMEAGVFSTLLALVIAVPIGLAAGYYRGWIDPVISRVTDVLLAFPFLILAVGLAAIFGPSLANATIALCVASVPLLIRVARGEALALREEDFVRAAVANGAGDRRILGRHILPNMASTLIVQATVLIPTAIIGEAVLSYLGVGVQPPTPSWGVMLVDGQNFISKEPRLVILPGLCIFLATLSFNLLGDGLRDMLDPRTRD